MNVEDINFEDMPEEHEVAKNKDQNKDKDKDDEPDAGVSGSTIC